MGAPVTLVGTDGAYVALPPRSMAIPENAQTYSAAFSSYAAYATPTDLMTLTGSATKTVAVTGSPSAFSRPHRRCRRLT
jgi:hypothetical protein